MSSAVPCLRPNTKELQGNRSVEVCACTLVCVWYVAGLGTVVLAYADDARAGGGWFWASLPMGSSCSLLVVQLPNWCPSEVRLCLPQAGAPVTELVMDFVLPLLHRFALHFRVGHKVARGEIAAAKVAAPAVALQVIDAAIQVSGWVGGWVGVRPYCPVLAELMQHYK